MKIESITKTLYIPIEIFDRELGGALILAVEAVKNGWTVILGGKQALFENIYRFSNSPGVFYLKSIVPGEVFKQDEIILLGHRIVSLDIEGLVRTSGSSGVKLRFSEQSIERCDLIFFWGEDHYNAVKKYYPQIQSKGKITGGPTIDELLIKKNNIVIPKSKRTKILIGTSCAFANNINGKDYPLQMTRNAYSGNLNNNEILNIESNAKRDVEVFNYWKEIIPIIAKTYPDFDVVVRPHPTENSDFWKSFLSEFKNVRIDTGSPIFNELISSSAYIHFNSTSAITSTILGIPTIMVIPELEDYMIENCSFVKNISTLAYSSKELIGIINESVNLAGTRKATDELNYYCENLKTNSLSASQKIIYELESYYKFIVRPFSIIPPNYLIVLRINLRKFKFFVLWFYGFFYRYLYNENSLKFPPRNAYKNAKIKQPHISRDKVLSDLSKLYTNGFIDNIEIKELSNNIFKINNKNE
jgi:surface carbohydrate biosynthesis protein